MVDEQEQELSLNPNLIIDGKQYYYSPAHQLAKHICKQTYDEFRLTCEYGFTSATIYIERVLQPGGYFSSTKYEPKKCIGVLLCDVETNRLTLQKTNVNPEKHELHKDDKRQMDECFGVQYEIFKYLRDSDLIRICTVERKERHKMNYVYLINKLKAVKNGRFLHFTGYGTQFFIPKADFKCFEGKKVTNKKKKGAKKNDGK